MIRRTKLLFDKKDRIRGLSFDGKQVLVGTEERGFKVSDNRGYRGKVTEYLDLLEKARNEHENAMEELEDVVPQTSERVDDLVEMRAKALEFESEEAHLSKQNSQKYAETLNPREQTLKRSKPSKQMPNTSGCRHWGKPIQSQRTSMRV